MKTTTTNPSPSWSTWWEIPAVVTHPRHARRTAVVAATVGTMFFLMNQLGPLLAGQTGSMWWIKTALTLLTPMIVSNIGVLSATRTQADEPPPRRNRRRRAIRRARDRRRLSAGLLALALAVVATGGSASAHAGDTARVYWFSDGSQVAGAWSTLMTSPAGAKMTLQTAELPTGHTVTVWWVVFNEPTNCSHPEGALRCGPGDLPIFGGDDSAVTSVLYAAGHEIGGSGQATFSGRLAIADASEALWGPGLVDTTGADIHLVVHDHGRLPPQQRAEGIHQFGPCEPECVDLQFSAHEQ